MNTDLADWANILNIAQEGVDSMWVTFGATFFGVIASFLLWYFGQWLLKQRHDKNAVRHLMREIREEIALNINILVSLAEDLPKTLAGGDIPVFLPHRMTLAVHRYLTLSGELRLLDVSQQRWILSAGMTSESFNRFVENTEAVLTSIMGLPNSLVAAKHRLDGLAEQAQDSAKNLSDVLAHLKVE